MSGATLILVSYVLLSIFVVAFVYRSVKIARMPVHLRWELAPIPHEKGKGHYGGSYLEEPEWWSKPREKDHVAEITYMVKEIAFLKALFEHNRRLWWFSFPFHAGLYLLTAMVGLLLITWVAGLAGLTMPAFVHMLIRVLAATGYLLGAVGAVGVLFSRLLQPQLRTIATPLTFLNLLVLLAFFVTGSWAVFTLPEFVGGLTSFVGALFSANLEVQFPAILTAHLVFAGIFLAYLPFTPMMHFVAKYFTYHEIRWNDEPLVPGSKTDKEIQELLQQPVTWAGPHLNADGKKNWVDIATDTAKKEAE
jgi:nitrate reductase gamma subunit